MTNKFLRPNTTIVGRNSFTTVDDVIITVSPYRFGVYEKIDIDIKGFNTTLELHEAQNLIDALYKSMESFDDRIFNDMIGNRLRKLSCQKCNHNWFPKTFKSNGTPNTPTQCPYCQSRVWNGKKRKVK